MRTPHGHPHKRYIRRTHLHSLIVQISCPYAHLDKTHLTLLASGECSIDVLPSAWNVHHLQDRAIVLTFDKMMLKAGVDSFSKDQLLLTFRVCPCNPKEISCVNREIR